MSFVSTIFSFILRCMQRWDEWVYIPLCWRSLPPSFQVTCWWNGRCYEQSSHVSQNVILYWFLKFSVYLRDVVLTSLSPLPFQKCYLQTSRCPRTHRSSTCRGYISGEGMFHNVPLLVITIPFTSIGTYTHRAPIGQMHKFLTLR